MNKKNRLLIVDDDELITTMFSLFFGARGFITEVVHNGEVALVKAQQFKPDIIILDVMMPKIDGNDVLDILKNTVNTSHIPVLILSALGSKEDRDKAQVRGADAFMEKSTVDLEAILEKVNELIYKN